MRRKSHRLPACVSSRYGYVKRSCCERNSPQTTSGPRPPTLMLCGHPSSVPSSNESQKYRMAAFCPLALYQFIGQRPHTCMANLVDRFKSSCIASQQIYRGYQLGPIAKAADTSSKRVEVLARSQHSASRHCSQVIGIPARFPSYLTGKSPPFRT